MVNVDKFFPRAKASKTSKGSVGYDNPRENIDPKIVTKAVISKEGSVETIPTEDSHIANKKYVDDKKVESLTTDLTTGSVVFSDGTNLEEDNGAFFWDNTNKVLILRNRNDPTKPTLTFGAGSGTGFYTSGSGSLRISIDGTLYILMDSAQWRFVQGSFRANIRNENPSATNPVYTFTADEDTGIGRGGTNILSLITGGTTGMTINAAQKVGIATTNPREQLHIFKERFTGDNVLLIDNSQDANSQIQFRVVATGAADNYQKGAIIFEPTNDGWGGGNMHFCVDIADNSGNAQISDAKITIVDSTGFVGIGTRTPNQLLTVKGTNAQISIEESDTEFVKIGVEATSGDMCIGWDDSDDMHLGVFSSPTDTTISDRVLISSGGDVTISAGNLIKNNFEVLSNTMGIVADATVTQGNNTITTGLTEVATVALAGNSITMPVIIIGMKIVVINNGVNAVGVFPNVGAQIDGAVINAAVNQAAGTTGIYHAWDATNWKKIEG